jgi:hypothetical protein
MGDEQDKKAREQHHLRVFREVFKDFPSGEVTAHEGQERPDVVVANASGRTGILTNP